MKALLTSFVELFSIYTDFHREHKSFLYNERSVQNKWVTAQVFLKSIFIRSYYLYFSCL